MFVSFIPFMGKVTRNKTHISLNHLSRLVSTPFPGVGSLRITAPPSVLPYVFLTTATTVALQSHKGGQNE